MKKAKLLILSAAILIGVGGALATKLADPPCWSQPQYYFDGTKYLPAGILGVNFICIGSSGTCTYVKNGDSYVPCRPGIHFGIEDQVSNKKK